MANPSQRSAEGKRSEKDYWEDRAAQLKRQLIERRSLTAIAQAQDISSSQCRPEEPRPEKQPSPDRACPTQANTTSAGQAQSNPGLFHKLHSGKVTPRETSKAKNPSILSLCEQQTPNGSGQDLAASIGTPVEKPPTSARSITVHDRMNHTVVAMAAKEVLGQGDAPPSTNSHAATSVPEKTNLSGCSKIQRGDQSTSSKEKHASRDTTKSTAVVADDQSNPKSSTKGVEPTTDSSAPQDKNPNQQQTHQQPSRNKTLPNLPTRIPAGASPIPATARTERRVSRPPVQSDTALSHSSAPRVEGRNNEYRRACSPARSRRTQDRNDHMTWESYKAPPRDHHHAYPGKASREQQRHRSASPGPRPPGWIDDGDRDRDGDGVGVGVGHRELERLTSRYPDLRDWLELTGWHVADYRTRQLDRLRRMAQIERARSQLEKEFDRDKARLKGYGEPASNTIFLSDAARRRSMLVPPAPPQQLVDEAQRPKYSMLGPYSVTDGLKRKRSSESDDDRDESFTSKYNRTSRNHHRGSRSGHHGPRGTYHRGREDTSYWQDRGKLAVVPFHLTFTPQRPPSTIFAPISRQYPCRLPIYVCLGSPHRTQMHHTSTTCPDIK
jgi:hypothetical protein